MMTVKAPERSFDPRELRRKLGLNQQAFWSRVGVTQSGGSRYESGRNIPKAVQELLRLVHVEQIDIENINREDFEILKMLKTRHTELYKTLRKEVRTGRKVSVEPF